jgi:hypothetical protein
MTVTRQSIFEKGLTRASWGEVRNLYALPSHTLQLIDSVPESKNRPVYAVSYRFGEQLATEQGFKLPEAAMDRASEFLHEFQDATSYSKLPLTLVALNSVEVYRENYGVQEEVGGDLLTTIPQAVLGSGEFFALYEVADYIFANIAGSGNPWNVSAGARTIRLLLPLNDGQVGEDVARYIERVHTSEPTFFRDEPKRWKSDNWHLIKTVVDYVNQDWHVVILVFPMSWIEGKDTKTSDFRKNLVHRAWRSLTHSRDEFLISDRIRRETRLQDKLVKFVKGSDHACREVLVHLLMMAHGQRVAFTGIPDETLMPTQEIKAFLNAAFKVRGARSKKIPSLVLPTMLKKPGDIGLFSLRQPLIEGLAVGGGSWPSLMRDFSALIDEAMRTILSDRTSVRDIEVYADFKSTQFSCQKSKSEIAAIPDFSDTSLQSAAEISQRRRTLHLGDPFLSGLIRLVRG